MKYLYGAAALVALIVVAAFVVPLLMDWNRFKPEIAEQIQAWTGRALAIDGEISVAILPSPKVTVAGARLANLESASTPDMVRVGALDLSLALGPLISGDLEITSLTLVEPVIELERLADGRRNWAFDAPRAETDAGDASADEPADERVVRIDSIAISDGVINYRDSASGHAESLVGIDATLSARSLDGPFRGEGTLQARNAPVAFRLATSSISERGDLPATIELDLGTDQAALVLEGTVQGVRSNPAFAGNVRASGGDLGAVLATLSIEIENDAVADRLGHPFAAKGTISASQTALALEALNLRLGESKATGSIGWRDAAVPEVDIALALSRLDLDALAGPVAAPEPGDQSAISSGATPAAKADGWANDGAFDLPADIAGRINISIGTLKYRDGVVRQAEAIMALDNGIVTIEQARALLPGGADVTAFGQLGMHAGAPEFAGHVEMVADDLRSLLVWLGLELDGVPADRLRRFSVIASLAADGSGVSASNLDIRVDSTRIVGTAHFDTAPRPMLAGDLAIDTVNADAYLATPSAAEGAQGEAATVARAEAGDAAADEPVDIAGDLAVLGTFDAGVQLAIGSLTYGGVRFHGVKGDLSLQQGDLALRHIEIADAAGLRVEASGAARDIATKPRIDVSVGAAAASLSRVMSALDLDPAFRPETLGRIAMVGTLNGDIDALSLNLKVNTQTANAAVVGMIETPLATPRINLGLRLRAPDAAELVRIAGAQPTDVVKRIGAIALDGGIEGNFDAMTVNLGAEAADASIQMAGTIESALDDLHYRVHMDLRHPRAARFAETVMGRQPSGQRYGPLHVRGEITGDRYAADVSGLEATIGPNQLTGGVFVRLDGPVPHLKADVRANELDISLFGAGGRTATTAGSGAVGSGSSTGSTRAADRDIVSRWSLKPIDLGALESFDAEFTLAADALLAGSYRFDQASLAMSVSNGVLTVHSLRGRVFDGALEAEGDVASGPEPSIRVSFRLDDIDVGMALDQAADVDVVSGRASIDGRFESEGASEYELVRSLRGDAAIDSRGGAVEGVDLAAITGRLNNLNNVASFISLAEEGLSQGRTEIRSIEGTITVEDGIARTDDLRVLSESGNGDVEGTADLPSWRLDLTALFRLADLPNAPPLGVRLTGPINAPHRHYLTDELETFLVARGLSTATEEIVLPRIRLREGASAEPGTVLDGALRELVGDPDDSRPRRAPPRRVQPAGTAQPLDDLVGDVLRRLD